MEKGILTKETTKALSEKLDDVVKLKGIWEVVDRPAFRTVINALDDNFGERIPDPYKSDIRDLLDQVIVDENYGDAIDLAIGKINELLDIPFLDDEAEAELFNALSSILKSILLSVE